MLKIEPKNGQLEYAPGGVIEGQVSWRLPHEPRDAYLRLIWYTMGRGTQDVQIVDEIEFPNPPAQYETSFRFDIPASPYSFDGTLISLNWALELVLDKAKESERLDILVSPWVTKLTLQPAEPAGTP